MSSQAVAAAGTWLTARLPVSIRATLTVVDHVSLARWFAVRLEMLDLEPGTDDVEHQGECPPQVFGALREGRDRDQLACPRQQLLHPATIASHPARRGGEDAQAARV